MELPQSSVRYRRGPSAPAPKDTVITDGSAATDGGAATPRKLELTKERCRTVDNGGRTALARSYSFEAQRLSGAQVTLTNGCDE